MIGQRLTIDRQLGARIRFARVELHLSEAALGALIGISVDQVTRLENGDAHISSEQLTEIAAALGKTVSFFFHDWVARSASASLSFKAGEQDPSTIELLATMLSDGTRRLPSGSNLWRASPTERDCDPDSTDQRVGYLQ